MKHRVESLVGCLFLLFTSSLLAAVAATSQATSQPAAEHAASPDKKLRVGFVVSLYTATGPSGIGRPYGYDHAEIVEKLHLDNAQLIPLIEPGSEEDEDMKNMIASKFPDADGQVMLATDLDSLKSLDAIVVYRAPNMKDEVLEGLTKAVQEGVGLLWVGPVGANNPGTTDVLNNLIGLKDGQYGYATEAVDMEIVAKDDPLLKGLDDTEKWKCGVNGFSGVFKDDVKFLVKRSTSDEITYPFKKVDESADFYLVYQAPLGKGTVIVCNWSGNPPEVINEEPSFYVRCIQRLAELRKK